MPNSWHKAVNDFPGRVAATTNFTFCSSTSMVFHVILYTPALATLARKCKGCPETFCKGCHETEHKERKRTSHPEVVWTKRRASPPPTSTQNVRAGQPHKMRPSAYTRKAARTGRLYW